MDEHEIWRWRHRPPGDAGAAGEPDAPEAEAGRVRYLHIVARTRLDLLLTLRRQFRDDASVHVMLDRRERDRRHQSRPVGFADRRRARDRRRPPEYWEDIARHPAVIIPLAPSEQKRDDDTAAPPALDTFTRERETSMDGDLTPERLLAWIEESRDVIQRVLPAMVDERDAARAGLQEAARRCDDLQAANDALRVEVARLTEAYRRLEHDHADVARRLGQFLAQISGALQPLSELQQRHPLGASADGSGPAPASGWPAADDRATPAGGSARPSGP